MVPRRRRRRASGRGKARRLRIIERAERLHAVREAAIMAMRQLRGRKVSSEKEDQTIQKQ